MSQNIIKKKKQQQQQKANKQLKAFNCPKKYSLYIVIINPHCEEEWLYLKANIVGKIIDNSQKYNPQPKDICYFWFTVTSPKKTIKY